MGRAHPGAEVVPRKLWLTTKTDREWVRDWVEMGYQIRQLDRALRFIAQQGWLSKAQRNKLRRMFRHELRRVTAPDQSR